MLRFGNIQEVDFAKGIARVRFPADALVSDWLPVISHFTRENKGYSMPSVGEQVVCIMDDCMKTGAIIGAIYSKADATPSGAGEGVFMTKFESGDLIKYDANAREWTVMVNETELIISAVGPTIKTASESLKSILVDLIDQILLETHPTAVGPSGTPANAAAYTAIKARINAFFEN